MNSILLREKNKMRKRLSLFFLVCFTFTIYSVGYANNTKYKDHYWTELSAKFGNRRHLGHWKFFIPVNFLSKSNSLTFLNLVSMLDSKHSLEGVVAKTCTLSSFEVFKITSQSSSSFE